MQIIKQLLKYYLYMISIFFIGRLTLFIIYFDKLQDSDSSIWVTFILGLRMDTIVANLLLAVPLILLTLSPKVLEGFVKGFLKYYFLFVMSLVIYIENATFPFIAQYDVRPNYLFVEYLEYPKEVFSMIIADYKLELLLYLVMIFPPQRICLLVIYFPRKMELLLYINLEVRFNSMSHRFQFIDFVRLIICNTHSDTFS